MATDDDEATVTAYTGSEPAPAAPAKVLAEVDPEATRVKAKAAVAEADAEATSVDPPRKMPLVVAPAPLRPSFSKRLARRFTTELRAQPGKEKPSLAFLGTVAILALSVLVAAFELATWVIGAPDPATRPAHAQQTAEERGVIDRLTNW